MYLDLSCTYDSSPEGTAVPILDRLSSFGSGKFSVVGESPLGACATNVNVVAQSGPTSGLTDADLGDWNCSVHEAFVKFPADYDPLALAPASSGFPSVFCGDDVTEIGEPLACGAPYILVSTDAETKGGSDISLSPRLGVAGLIGGSVTVHATVARVAGVIGGIRNVPVTLSTDSGPGAGHTARRTTDRQGEASFDLRGPSATGTSVISASFRTSAGQLEQSNSVTVQWVKPRCPSYRGHNPWQALRVARCALAPAIQVAECANALLDPLSKTTKGAQDIDRLANVLVRAGIFKRAGSAKGVLHDLDSAYKIYKYLSGKVEDILTGRKAVGDAEKHNLAAVAEDLASLAGYGSCVQVLANLSNG